MFIWPWAAGTRGWMNILQLFWPWLYCGWQVASSNCSKRSRIVSVFLCVIKQRTFALSEPSQRGFVAEFGGLEVTRDGSR